MPKLTRERAASSSSSRPKRLRSNPTESEEESDDHSTPNLARRNSRISNGARASNPQSGFVLFLDEYKTNHPEANHFQACRYW